MNTLLSRITIDPQVCHGKPVIRGLRYPVESMLEYLADGDSVEEVLAEFADLERDDLLACIEFAAQSLGQDKKPPSRANDSVFHPSRLINGASTGDIAAHHDVYLYDVAPGKKPAAA